MSSDPPLNPYLALGLSKDATAQQIKATYRKLVLKFHPDKVIDESLKAAAVDNFHKIQTAYELLGDEGKRAKYDASQRLAELQKAYQKEKEHAERHRSSTAAKAQSRSASFAASPSDYRDIPSAFPQPPRYETMRPRNTYDSDHFDEPSRSRPSSRKHSYPDVDSKKQSKSDERKKHRDSDKSKHDRKKTTERGDRDRRRDRATKTDSKKAYVVPDRSDSEIEQHQKRYDSARETSKEYVRGKKESSESDASDHEARNRRNITAAMLHMGRTDDLGADTRRAPPLKSPVDRFREEPVSHHSTRSPARDSRKDSERQRQYSDSAFFRSENLTKHRPPLEKYYTAPPDKFADRERRSKTASASRPHLDTPLKRSETVSVFPRRHDANPERSGVRHERHHDATQGIPTPPLSPPKEHHARDTHPSKSSRRYVIEEEHLREVSPGTKPRHPRSPSPIHDRERSPRDRDRRARTHEPRRHSDHAESPLPSVPYPIRTGHDGVFAQVVTDSPRSARHMAPADDYFRPQKEAPLFGEIFNPWRRSPREGLPPDTDYATKTMKPEERRSSRSSRPKMHRSHTHHGRDSGIMT